MRLRSRKPSGRAGYLNDPNYYRLGYQLAAQQMNVACSQRGRRDSALPTALDILYGEFSRGEPAAAGPARAEETAKRITEAAEETLAWYAERERFNWGLPRRRPLTVPERRLSTFLKRTVIPCLQLVSAASLREGEPIEARGLTDLVRRQADEGKVSYRVFYNLACFEAGDKRDESRNRALEYLGRALVEAPGDRAAELVEWARRDPSLEKLQGEAAFKQLLERFEPYRKHD